MAGIEDLIREAERRGIKPRASSALARVDAEVKRRGLTGPRETSVREQGMNGLNEGVAGLLGAPVDLATSAINLGIKGVNKATGSDVQAIEDPVGGSGTFRRGLAGWGITDAEPQTRGQRYARRVGQEVGFGAPIALATGGLSAGASIPRVMGANALADTSAGVAGQTAREVAPNSALADIFASTIAGGGVGLAQAAAMKARPPAPHNSTDEMFEASGRAYKRANESGVALTRPAQEDLFSRLGARLKAERASPRRHPRAFDALEEAKQWPNARLGDVEETRAIFGRDVAGNADEAKIGVAMKQEIDDYLNGLDASKTTGANPEQAIADLQEGRKLAHQGHKAQAVEGQEYRAATRAATSGTGGNQVNAMRQNVRTILNNEVAPARSGKTHGYTPDEVKQMERIVFGTPGQNALRWGSRFAPSAGALQGTFAGAASGMGLASAILTGNPLAAALAVPSLLGEGAKQLAERGTRRELDTLLDTIRRGGVAAPKVRTATGDALLRALLATSADQPR